MPEADPVLRPYVTDDEFGGLELRASSDRTRVLDDGRPSSVIGEERLNVRPGGEKLTARLPVLQTGLLAVEEAHMNIATLTRPSDADDLNAMDGFTDRLRLVPERGN